MNEHLLLSPVKTFYSKSPNIASVPNRPGVGEQFHQKFSGAVQLTLST